MQQDVYVAKMDVHEGACVFQPDGNPAWCLFFWLSWSWLRDCDELWAAVLSP